MLVLYLFISILNCNFQFFFINEISNHYLLKGQEKWSSVRITEKKNSMKIENHISVHSNLNLNGLVSQVTDSTLKLHKGIGNEVKYEKKIVCIILYGVFCEFVFVEFYKPKPRK